MVRYEFGLGCKDFAEAVGVVKLFDLHSKLEINHAWFNFEFGSELWVSWWDELLAEELALSSFKVKATSLIKCNLVFLCETVRDGLSSYESVSFSYPGLR